MSCSKTPNECQYRFDYRGCNLQNCKYPEEFHKKELKEDEEFDFFKEIMDEQTLIYNKNKKEIIKDAKNER